MSWSSLVLASLERVSLHTNYNPPIALLQEGSSAGWRIRLHVLELSTQAAKMHSAIHQDIKPANIHKGPTHDYGNAGPACVPVESIRPGLPPSPTIFSSLAPGRTLQWRCIPQMSLSVQANLKRRILQFQQLFWSNLNPSPLSRPTITVKSRYWLTSLILYAHAGKKTNLGSVAELQQKPLQADWSHELAVRIFPWYFLTFPRHRTGTSYSTLMAQMMAR